MTKKIIDEYIDKFIKLTDEALQCQINELLIKTTKHFDLLSQLNNEDLVHTLCEKASDKLFELIDTINNCTSKNYDIFNINDIKNSLMLYTENFILSYITLTLLDNYDLIDVIKDNSPLVSLLSKPLPKSYNIISFFKSNFPQTNSIFDKIESNQIFNTEVSITELTDILCKTGEPSFAKENICRYIISTIDCNYKIENWNIYSALAIRSKKLKIDASLESAIKNITISIPINELKFEYLNWFLDTMPKKVNVNIAIKNYDIKVSMLNNCYIPFMLQYTWNFLTYLSPKYIITELILDRIQSGMIFIPSSKISNNFINKSTFKYKDYVNFENIKLDLHDYLQAEAYILKNKRQNYSIYDIAKEGIKSYSRINNISSLEYLDELSLYIEECIYSSVSLCTEEQIDIMELSKTLYFSPDYEGFDNNSHYLPFWRFIQHYNPIQRISKNICDELNYEYDIRKLPTSYTDDINITYNFFGSNKKNSITNKALNYDDFNEFITNFIEDINTSSLNEKMKMYKINSLERAYCFDFICTLCKYISSDKRIEKFPLNQKLYFVNSVSVLSKIPLITYRKKLLRKYLNNFILNNLDIHDIESPVTQIIENTNYSMLFVINVIKNVDPSILINSLNDSVNPKKCEVFRQSRKSKLNTRWYKKITTAIYNNLI